jgi:hypothetical protein
MLTWGWNMTDIALAYRWSADRRRIPVGRLQLAGAAVALLLLVGCSDVVESHYGRNYPPNLYDASDLDYCNNIALATLHTEGEISSDIGREFETSHAEQGPETLERNMAAYEERRKYDQIVRECLRKRRASRPIGTTQ